MVISFWGKRFGNTIDVVLTFITFWITAFFKDQFILLSDHQKRGFTVKDFSGLFFFFFFCKMNTNEQDFLTYRVSVATLIVLPGFQLRLWRTKAPIFAARISASVSVFVSVPSPIIIASPSVSVTVSVAIPISVAIPSSLPTS